MLPETFLQPDQSHLVVRDGQRQRSPALHFVCARCKSASAYNCAAELVRSCSVECGAALSSSRSIAARRRGELVSLLSQSVERPRAVLSARGTRNW